MKKWIPCLALSALLVTTVCTAQAAPVHPFVKLKIDTSPCHIYVGWALDQANCEAQGGNSWYSTNNSCWKVMKRPRSGVCPILD